MSEVLTVVLGLVSGAVSGAFSMGGVTLQQPGIRLLGGTPFEAIGTTAPVLVPMTVSAVLRYSRAGLVSVRAAAWIVPSGLVGSVVGALSTRRVPGDGHVLQLGTAALLAYAALSLLARDRWAPTRLDGLVAPDPEIATAGRRRRLVLLGLFAGAAGGLLGIGGGVVLVPGLHHLVGMSLKRAIATSLLAVGFLAVPSTFTHHAMGGVRWDVVLLLSAGVVPGAWVGAHLTALARRRAVTVATGVLLLGLSAAYAAGEIGALVGR